MVVENIENLKLVVAGVNDSKDIWKWRNDSCARKMFKNTEIVNWNEHVDWYNKALKNKNILIYIAMIGDHEKVGMTRFDINEDKKTVEVSINVAPKHRGKSICKKMLAKAVEKLNIDDDYTITATIKLINFASINCFTSCGFVFIGESGEYNQYQYAR